jgi:peroxiredoxin
MINVGDTAPDFELPSNLLGADGKPGKPVKLGDYRGKNVLLAFYPLDFSPTCTKENACFVDDLPRFQTASTQLLGISVDHKWAHHAYAEKMKIVYPLLADFQPRGAVAERYGLFNEKAGMTKRATVIIDKSGKVAFVAEHQDQRDNKALLDVLARLQ